MNIAITSKKEEPLLSRTVVCAECTFEGKVPSKEEVKKEIIPQLKANENYVVIHKIETIYGAKKAKITAYVYNSEDAMKKVEPKKKEKNEKEKQAPAKSK